MGVNISASAIADYLSCSQKVKFRIASSDQQIQTPEMLTGTIVHEILEKYNDRTEALGDLNSRLESSGVDNTMKARAINSVDNFFDFFHQFVTPEDSIEIKFKLPYLNGINLVGKFDRITPDGKIFDWKTSAVCPRDISNNVQFIFYYECYRKIYGEEPSSLFYAHLLSKKLVRYVPNKTLTNYLFNEVIPRMIYDIKNDRVFKTGLYTGICKNCAFQKHCLSEMGYVVDSRKFN